MTNPFFKNKGPFEINNLLKFAELKNIQKYKNLKIYDVKYLSISTKNYITFFHSKKYEAHASKQKLLFVLLQIISRIIYLKIVIK